VRLSDPERSTLVEIGRRLGRTALQQVACVARPDTILAWYRRLIPRKFDGTKSRASPGRPRIAPDLGCADCPLRQRELRLGIRPHRRSPGQARLQRLRPYGGQHPSPLRDPAAPKRSQNTTWKDFIASHLAVLTGTDFFTVEVLTWRGLATYYALFFIHLESRRVSLAGLTKHPTAEWMLQMARNATDESVGFLRGQRYLLHDRDTKFCAAFLDVLRSSGRRPIALPPRSPNLNAFAEHWVGAIRQECLSKLILFGGASLRRALIEYIDHHHVNGTTRVRAIFFSSLLQTCRRSPGPLAVATDSVACSSSTPESLDTLTTRGRRMNRPISTTEKGLPGIREEEEFGRYSANSSSGWMR
jgi:hypothetical protein